MIITVTFNPAIDKTAEIDSINIGGLNRLKHVLVDAGGKGINVSKTIQALGGSSLCSGFLAGSTGEYIQKDLQSAHIKCDFVWVDGITRTNVKVLDKNLKLTELNEAGPIIGKQDVRQLVDKLISYTSANTIVVLAGSVPIGVEDKVYRDIITEIKKAKGRVLFDAAGSLLSHGLQARPNIIKPNKFELFTHFNVSQNCSNEELLGLAKTLLNEETEMVIVSLGKEGAFFIMKDAIFIGKGLPIRAHSSVGAGDAMVGAVAYAIEQGFDREKLICLAMACSAGAVMSKGTKPANKKLVEELMKQVKIENIGGFI